MNPIRSILRAIGSLWFASVLLMLLLVAMACATVYESTNGTDQALAAFYRSVWFEVLLYLVCINVAAAVLARYPFKRKHVGFVITHTAIILTLLGALITERFGVDGQVAVAEGQRVEQFSLRTADALTITDSEDERQASVPLDSSAFRDVRVVEHPQAPTLTLDDVQINVLRYLPDTVWSRNVSSVDTPDLPAAIEVSLSGSHGDSVDWVFAGQRPVTVGPTSVSFRSVSSPGELAQWLSEAASSRPVSVDIVKVVCNGETFEIPLEQCQGKAAAVGETGYTVQVLRYLPHATVGPDNRLTNASDQPLNPAIEVEVVGPSGRERRIAFARFPGFSHGKDVITEVDLTFVSGSQAKPAAPLEILAGPDGRMYARFERDGTTSEPQELQVGTPIETPWPGHRLSVLQQFAHAQVEWSLEPHGSVRETAMPGLLVEIRTPDYTHGLWVQKHDPRSVRIGEKTYELTYSARQVPLGFGLTLNSFRIGTYPGTERPRSFESQITTEEAVTGRTQNHVISMNHPAKVGGYTLYQSSYSQSARGPAISDLSVSRDPGQPVVFAGYIAMMVGMAVVLWTRITERRGRAAVAASDLPAAR
jgi:hypothetical protein